MMCIHETRRQDYATYAKEIPGTNDSWENQQRSGIPCGHEDDHPVVGVTWEDSVRFCEWLSKKEGKIYRLPTDREWSIAVGLGRKENHSQGMTPAALSQKEQTIFPWGGDYPPKSKDKSGNYADKLWHAAFPNERWIKDYNDNFLTTAPVMSFKPNIIGLHDMGGNVWEWVEDLWNNGQDHALRGASFSNHDHASLLSSRRGHDASGPYERGFRCVLDLGGKRSSNAPTTSSQETMSPSPVMPSNVVDSLLPKPTFTNSLGMNFVPVPGTHVLMCIHETRFKDYYAFSIENPGVDGSWKNQIHDNFAITEHHDDHPVVYVSWEDGQKFCEWLSKIEGKLYRLPTDEEWSYAVGIGRGEKQKEEAVPSQVPQMQNEFPWGGDFPPKTKDEAGNYSDASRKAKTPRDDEQYLENYDDGFPTTAPVMNYKPNKLGLYDLGGNVCEMTSPADIAQSPPKLRGGAWYHCARRHLLSSYRYHGSPGGRANNRGFRIVVVVQ